MLLYVVRLIAGVAAGIYCVSCGGGREFVVIRLVVAVVPAGEGRALSRQY